MQIRDRIKSLRRVKASELLPNPRNWRKHPDHQTNALRGILAEVGWADAVLAYETDYGLQLIDGHARAELAPNAEIPVLVLDVTDDEANMILATHDPLMGMAETDHATLDDLLGDVESHNEAVADLLSSLKSPDDFFDVDSIEMPELPADDEGRFRTMSFQVTEEQQQTIKHAIARAKAGSDFGDTGNPNANGNALAVVAEGWGEGAVS